MTGNHINCTFLRLLKHIDSSPGNLPQLKVRLAGYRKQACFQFRQKSPEPGLARFEEVFQVWPHDFWAAARNKGKLATELPWSGLGKSLGWSGEGETVLGGRLGEKGGAGVRPGGKPSNVHLWPVTLGQPLKLSNQSSQMWSRANTTSPQVCESSLQTQIHTTKNTHSLPGYSLGATAWWGQLGRAGLGAWEGRGSWQNKSPPQRCSYSFFCSYFLNR